MVSLHTALVIQAQNTKVTTHLSRETKKHGFEIYWLERENYRPLLSSEALYETREQALEEGKRVRDEIKNLNL